MENICGINCLYNIEEAKEEKQDSIRFYESKMEDKKRYNKICTISSIVMMIAVVVFITGSILIGFHEEYMGNTILSFLAVAGITCVVGMIVFSRYDTKRTILMFFSLDDIYGIAEHYLIMRENNENIVDAKITIEDDEATLHLFVEKNDENYGSIIQERTFGGIPIMKTKDETVLDLNGEVYYMKVQQDGG